MMRIGVVMFLFLTAAAAYKPAVFCYPNDHGRSVPSSTAIRRRILKAPDPDQQNGTAISFEITKPIDLPPHTSPCSVLLLKYSFNYTIISPPVIANYTPSKECLVFEWEKVVLRWKATSKGTQYDRYAAVWLSGVEILRTTTAEPTPSGIEWEVVKDITRYSVLLKDNQSVAVSLPNLVNQDLNGIYNLILTAEFYPQLQQGMNTTKPDQSLRPADAILPISQTPPLNGEGYWFLLQDNPDEQNVSVTVPVNAYKATLEIYLSHHGNDEFWYTNPTNDYIRDNNLAQPGNGPFREILVLIDNFIVGAVWPFPVIYTGGINPSFWVPSVAIGAFNLPSYDIDITPFLGVLVDGKAHNVSLKLDNGLSFWLVDANLHLWLDPNSAQVTGSVVEYRAPEVEVEYRQSYLGLNGNISVTALRSIYCSGYVLSSQGNTTTSSSHTFEFSNLQTYSNNANNVLIEQLTQTNGNFTTKLNLPINDQGYDPDQKVGFVSKESSYPLSYSTGQLRLPNATTLMNNGIRHALNEDVNSSSYNVGLESDTQVISSSLRNSQEVEELSNIFNNTVLSDHITRGQNYSYKSPGDCYYRSLTTRDKSLVSDIINTSC